MIEMIKLNRCLAKAARRNCNFNLKKAFHAIRMHDITVIEIFFTNRTFGFFWIKAVKWIGHLVSA